MNLVQKLISNAALGATLALSGCNSTSPHSNNNTFTMNSSMHSWHFEEQKVDLINAKHQRPDETEKTEHHYAFVPRTPGTSIKFKGNVLSENVVLEGRMVPMDEAKEKRTLSGFEMTPRSEFYHVVNAYSENNTLKVNQGEALRDTFVVLSTQEFPESTTDGKLGILSKRILEAYDARAPKVNIGGTELLTVRGLNPFGPDRVYIATDGAEPVYISVTNDGVKSVKFGVQGSLFLPIEGYEFTPPAGPKLGDESRVIEFADPVK